MFTAIAEVEKTMEVYTSLLPVLAVFLPLLGSLIVFLIGTKNEKLRDWSAVAVALAAFLTVMAHFPFMNEGILEYQLMQVMNWGLLFRVDMLSFIFAFIISLVWLLAAIFSVIYMRYEHARNRYYMFLLFTLGACLGVVMTGDLFTLFLFFELMTFSSYVLVIHEEEKEAMSAGRLYLYLGVIGGLALLFAILLLFHETGTSAITPLMEQLARGDMNLTVVLVLFFIGFGIKAGMVPLHIWLPRAHPVAPSPASALLSGIMIKAGAYGILRVLLTIYSPARLSFYEEAGSHLLYSQQAGYWVIWIGIITMFLGACMALLSNHAKRILAYSSVSQMGYILMGIGVTAYLGAEGAMGFAGTVYHIFNHAFFKSGLFLMVGAVFIYTRDLDITRVRGMIKKFPLVAGAFLAAAFGIGGIPGFNGYASKTLLHDAMLEAVAHSGSFSIYIAERLFVITSALTICYFIKLFRGLFLGPLPEEFNKNFKVHPVVNFVVLFYAGIITAIGLFPNYVLEKLIMPAAELFTYDHHGIEHLTDFHFFSLHPLEAMGIVVMLAAGIYIVGNWRRWFDWQPPRWLSIQFLVYYPVWKFLMLLTRKSGEIPENAVNKLYCFLGRTGYRVCIACGLLDKGLNDVYKAAGSSAYKAAEHSAGFDKILNEAYKAAGSSAYKTADRSARFDKTLNDVYQSTGRAVDNLAEGSTKLDNAIDETYLKGGRTARHLADKGTELEEGLNKAYEKTGESTQNALKAQKELVKREKLLEDASKWNTKNLNFDALLMAIIMGIVLVVLFVVFVRW